MGRRLDAAHTPSDTPPPVFRTPAPAPRPGPGVRRSMAGVSSVTTPGYRGLPAQAGRARGGLPCPERRSSPLARGPSHTVIGPVMKPEASAGPRQVAASAQRSGPRPLVHVEFRKPARMKKAPRRWRGAFRRSARPVSGIVRKPARRQNAIFRRPVIAWSPPSLPLAPSKAAPRVSHGVRRQSASKVATADTSSCRLVRMVKTSPPGKRC